MRKIIRNHFANITAEMEYKKVTKTSFSVCMVFGVFNLKRKGTTVHTFMP